MLPGTGLAHKASCHLVTVFIIITVIAGEVPLGIHPPRFTAKENREPERESNFSEVTQQAGIRGKSPDFQEWGSQNRTSYRWFPESRGTRGMFFLKKKALVYNQNHTSIFFPPVLQ